MTNGSFRCRWSKLMLALLCLKLLTFLLTLPLFYLPTCLPACLHTCLAKYPHAYQNKHTCRNTQVGSLDGVPNIGEWLTLKQWTADRQCDGGKQWTADREFEDGLSLSLSLSLSLPPSLYPFCPSPFVFLFPIRTAKPHTHPPSTVSVSSCSL